MNRCFKNNFLFFCIFLAVSFSCFSACTIGGKTDLSRRTEQSSPICRDLDPGDSLNPWICKKQPPEITFNNLTPPYKDYAYFQFREFFPFEYRGSSFSLINAWWLAEASTLVYADETYARKRFNEAGFDRVAFFDCSGTQFYVASNSRFAIVAFRGSEIWKRNEAFDPKQIVADLRTDIDIRMADWDRGGKVHSGFKSALDRAWDDLLPEIENLRKQDIAVWVTGHSLGGALAVLAADRLQDVGGVYTFGAPRIGNQAFRDNFRPQAFRIVNGKDIVPRVPLKIRYRHVGEIVYIDADGRLNCPDGILEQDRDDLSPQDANDSENDKPIQEVRSSIFIPDMIRDHVPLLYSIFIWNELVEGVDKC